VSLAVRMSGAPLDWIRSHLLRHTKNRLAAGSPAYHSVTQTQEPVADELELNHRDVALLDTPGRRDWPAMRESA